MPKIKITSAKGIEQTAGSGFSIDGTKVVSSAQSLDQLILTTELADVSTSSSTFITSPHAGNLTAVYSSIGGAIASGDAILTVKAAGVTVGTITIANAASAAGTVDSLVGVSQALSAGQVIEIATNGGSTNTITANLTLIIER